MWGWGNFLPIWGKLGVGKLRSHVDDVVADHRQKVHPFDENFFEMGYHRNGIRTESQEKELDVVIELTGKGDSI